MKQPSPLQLKDTVYKTLKSIVRFFSEALKIGFLFFIQLYQKFISPLLGSNCKHYPSCSSYSAEAINKHGAAKGLVLSSFRLLRCNPWSYGGYDPVPKQVQFKKPESFKIFGNYQTKLYK
jgi:putative membrane protein insertion efficiency factor